LEIFDISTPNAPNKVLQYTSAGNVFDVKIVDNKAYLAAGTSGLVILDISDPTAPTQVGSADTPGEAWDIVVSDNYAYIADKEGGLQIIDVTDPKNPAITGNFPTDNWANDVFVSGNYAYMTDYGTMQIIDVSNKFNPKLVYVFAPDGEYIKLSGVCVSGNYAYVAVGINWGSTNNISILNVTDPPNATVAATISKNNETNKIYISNNYLYLANNSMEIFDISDPVTLTPVFQYHTSSFAAKSVNTSGGYIYLSNTSSMDILTDVVTNIEETTIAFGKYAIKSYPNPFTNETTIRFNLKNKTKVTIEIIDVTGKIINTLLNSELTTGEHKVKWNGCNQAGCRMPKGLYMYRFMAGDYRQTQKLLLK
jgi:hypothetical protein